MMEEDVQQLKRESEKMFGKSRLSGMTTNITQYLIRKFREYKRVLRSTKKPNKEELKIIVKVSGIGMAVIGLIGFLLHFLKEIIL